MALLSERYPALLAGVDVLRTAIRSSRGEIFRSNLQQQSRKLFFLTSHAAEIAYFSSANRKLSNAVRVVELR